VNKEIYIGSIEKRLTGLKCPHCGRPADGATSLDDRQAARMPKPGSFAICLSCGSINIYTDTLGLRRIERAERRRMQRDPRMAKLIEIALDAVKHYRRGIQ
jgi:hypothetical protein